MQALKQLRLILVALGVSFAAIHVGQASAQPFSHEVKHHGDAYPDHPITRVTRGHPGSGPRPGLVIVPSFDSSITDDPNSAAMQTAIYATITQLQSQIRTRITVNILFVNVNNGLGGSATAFPALLYSQYLLDLRSVQRLSPFDKRALKTLPSGPANPANGGPDVKLSTPNLRAVGETVLGDNGGGYDSTIFLNMSLMNFLRTGPQDPSKYDLEQVALHEICEVLGVGGGGSRLAGTDVSDVGPLDLFRYSARGIRSFTNSDVTVHAYFSIDGGKKNLGFFDNLGDGDYGDWDSELNGFPQVQDAFSTPGVQLDLNRNEWISLDIVGYDLNPDILDNDD